MTPTNLIKMLISTILHEAPLSVRRAYIRTLFYVLGLLDHAVLGWAQAFTPAELWK